MPRGVPKDSRPKAKGYCLTINHPTEDDVDCINNVRDKVEYYIFGAERGEGGTDHFQGYVHYKNKVRLTQVKSDFPRAHIEVRRGTVKEAVDYCKKENNWADFGTMPVDGPTKQKRNFARIIEMAKQGRLAEIEKTDPGAYVQYYSTIKRIAQDNPIKHPPLDALTNFWYIGEPGTGKSRYARERYPDLYLHLPNKWWDGYNQESTVLVEDLDHQHAAHMSHNLKIWADHYPFPAEVKGTSIMCRPARIIVTSNYTPEELWPRDPKLVDAIRRRFSFVTFPLPKTDPTPDVIEID